SIGLTLTGARALASSASRSAICAQRDASGVCIRRIKVERKGPLAAPHGASPRPSLPESSAPTFHGSRRAQPGYSTGGLGGTTAVDGLEFDTSSTAVSSAPPSGNG